MGMSTFKLPRVPSERRKIFMEDFLKAVANIGFPIAVAAYLLIRIESKLDSLAASINQLSTILSIKLGGSDDRKSA
jgi:hypothetical protein